MPDRAPHDSASSAPEGLVDAHVHLDFVDAAVREAMVARARRAGVGRFVIAGYSPTTFARASELAGDDVAVCVGLHPWALGGSGPDDVPLDAIAGALDALRAAATQSSAVGEVGLDAARAAVTPMALQEQVFEAAARIAQDASRTLVVHAVRAHDRAVAVLRRVKPTVPVVVHGFTGNATEARAYLAMDAHLSLGHALLDPRRAPKLLAAVRGVPLDRLLLESDAPAREGAQAREPASVAALCRVLAEARGAHGTDVAGAVANNADRLFFARRHGAPAE